MVKKLSAFLREEWTDYRARAWQRHLMRQLLRDVKFWRAVRLHEIVD